MSKSLSLIFLVLLLIAPVLAQDDETLTIAFIGSENAADQTLYHAAQLAVEDINALTGDDELRDTDDNLYQLQLRFYEASSESEALDAYEEAVDDEVLAVLMSSDRDNLESLAEDASLTIPVFHAAADGPSGNGFYRLVADYETQAHAIADYMVNERHFSQIAVANNDSASAQNVRDSFVTDVAANGAEVVFDRTHDADTTDFQTAAEDIRESGAEALLLWTLDTQAIDMLKALEAEGWDGLIFYNNLSSNFIGRAGDLAQNLMTPLAWTALAYDSQSVAFRRDFVAQWETEPSALSAAYYDAVSLLAEAVRTGGENAAGELNSLDTYDGIQAVYTDAQAQDIFLAQYSGTELLEAARYTAGVCMNCLDTWRAEQSTETIVSRDSLVIALLVPDEGTAETVGTSIENAVELAISEINDLGGLISGDVQYTLILRTYSANDAQEAAAALQQAKDDGAVVIMGLDFNAQVLDNLTIVGDLALPQFVSASDSRIPVLERSDNALQIRTNDAAVVDAVTTYLVNERELDNFSIIAARTDYAREARAAAEDVITASDEGRLELSLNYDLGKGDFTALAAQIAASETEALLVLSPSADALELLKALEAAGYEGTFVYPYLTPETLSNFQSETVEVLGTSNWWSSAGDWASRQFTMRYSETYGEAPFPQAVSYYDAIYWLAQGLESVGSETGQLGARLLETERFVGVQGEYLPGSYGEGEAIRSIIVGRIGAEGFEEIARYNGTACLIGCE